MGGIKKKKLNNTDYQILEKITESNKVSRTELAETLDLTPAAITKAIKNLINSNIIVEKNQMMSTGGRPRKILAINPNYKKIIGINLGAGFIKVALCSLTGDLLHIIEKTFSFKSEEKILNLLEDKIDEMLKKCNKDEIVGIGLATHGMVDRKKGVIIMSPHFRWKNFDIKKELEQKYELPVIVENDVRAMLMAEYSYIYSKKLKNFMLLYIKNGIGAALLLNGEIYKGSNFASGEIGHYIIKEDSILQCRCGKYGCLETEYSEHSILNKISLLLEEQNIKEILDIETIYRRAKNRERPYVSIIEEAGFEIGKVVGNVLNILDLNDVVIAGDIVMTGNIFINNFKKGINKMLLDVFNKKIKVSASKLDDKIGVYGAVSLITTNLFSGEKLLKL